MHKNKYIINNFASVKPLQNTLCTYATKVITQTVVFMKIYIIKPSYLKFTACLQQTLISKTRLDLLYFKNTLKNITKN